MIKHVQANARRYFLTFAAFSAVVSHITGRKRPEAEEEKRGTVKTPAPATLKTAQQQWFQWFTTRACAASRVFWRRYPPNVPSLLECEFLLPISLPPFGVLPQTSQPKHVHNFS